MNFLEFFFAKDVFIEQQQKLEARKQLDVVFVSNITDVD